MQIETLTLKQMQQLKRDRYKDAQNQGVFLKLALIARELGERLSANCGPKYQWTHDAIRVYKDDYGGFMTVHVGDKKAASTHACDLLFIPGEWVEQALAFYPEAERKKAARDAEYNSRQRAQLVAQLTL